MLFPTERALPSFGKKVKRNPEDFALPISHYRCDFQRRLIKQQTVMNVERTGAVVKPRTFTLYREV